MDPSRHPFPENPQDVTLTYIRDVVTRSLQDPGYAVKAMQWVPMQHEGTSGAKLYRLQLEMTGPNPTLRLILKIGGSKHETLFYQKVADRLPIPTPRIFDARFLSDGTSWVLMEEILDVKSGLDWTIDEYRLVVSDMARFHAANWGDSNQFFNADWITKADAQSVNQRIERVKQSLDAVAGSWIPQAVPDVFSPKRLRLIESVLDRPGLLDPLLDLGCTLVHGDYWFHNVMITQDGRRLLIDWDSYSIWSGLWELAYFLNFLKAVGPGKWRDELPITEQDASTWYWRALQEHGVNLDRDRFEYGLLVARVWQPLAHWLRQFEIVASRPKIVPSHGNVQFLHTTFSRWEHDANML